MNRDLQNYYKKMQSLPLNDPRYIDPLYLPYHTNKSISPLKYPLSINSGYPLNDPYRRHMGKGLAFRSKYFGYCPQGYVNLPDKNSRTPDNPNGINTGMCYPVDQENDNKSVDKYRFEIQNNQPIGNMPPSSGTFYSSVQDSMNPRSWLNSYGNNPEKYTPRTYASTPYNANSTCTVGDMRSLVGKYEDVRVDMADCILRNFW
jgi:hypothetical protein